MVSGRTFWLPADEHSGENTGDTETHVLLVELEALAPRQTVCLGLGPSLKGPPALPPRVDP
jgi:beta-alanine degradation protein BauB